MNTILAVCMATLFSWWICSLKIELAKRQSQPPAKSETPPPEPVIPADLLAKPHPVHAHAHPQHQESAKRRNAGGVPVWTIG